MVSRGTADAREPAHARVLLQADEAEGGPGWIDATIAAVARVSVRTIERARRRLVEQGLAALVPEPSPRLHAREPDGEGEAHRVASARARPPEGEARRSLRPLAARMAALGHADALSPETVRRTLKRTRPSRT